MSKSIKDGILHTHTEASVRDSAMTLTQMFKRAKELNAPAIAVTDHGIMAGIFEFLKEAKKNGIKGIPGIEFYYDSGMDIPGIGRERQHLIAMARDRNGLEAIFRAVYLSYEHVLKDEPCVTDEILKECFGEGTTGYGHVVITSACMAGPIATILRYNSFVERSVKKLRNRRDKYAAPDDEFREWMKKEAALNDEIASVEKKRDELKEASKINLTGLKRRLKAEKDSAEYEKIKKELEEKEAIKETAKQDLEEIKQQLKAKKAERSKFANSIASQKKEVESWKGWNHKIKEALESKKDSDILYAEARDKAAFFRDLFGDNNFFIELQYHHIKDEQLVMPISAKIAQELNIPVVAANDAHYATNSDDDVRRRTIVSAMRFNQMIEEKISEEGYGELYIKDDEALSSILREILEDDVVEQAMRNIGTIVASCEQIELDDENHFPVFLPSEEDKIRYPNETADERLERICRESIPKRYPNTWDQEKEDRMNYELSVIQKMGFSDYLCIVADYVSYGKTLGKYSVGPGRGSAVGSIVCYLSGIIEIDPIKYGLMFERFLNPERVSMPDIDVDFAPSIRNQVIAYVQAKYSRPELGETAIPICSIITRGTMAARKAIRSAARVTGVSADIADRLAKSVPFGVHPKIDDIPDLQKQCDNPVIRQLVSDAKLIEGTTVDYGSHAAGIIISDNGDIGKYVPLYRKIAENTATGPYIAQLDKVQCEDDAHLLKMDFLGLKNIDIIQASIEAILKNHGIEIDPNHIPQEPEVFEKIFSEGNTDSVFQFESNGMKSLLKDFRPSTMDELVLLVAAYRPGPIQYLPKILQIKHGEEYPFYIADGLQEIMEETYGVPIYQEQVMAIFHKIGGFSLGEADIIRRAMSKKKLSVLTDPDTNYKGKLIDGFVAHKATPEQAEQFWEELLNFASYAFNKSHAATYATISYVNGYLKYHFPAEYMSAVLTFTDFDKLSRLIQNCKQMGLEIQLPDINKSKNEFVGYDKKILFGFTNIKEVGNSGKEIVAERENHGIFTSFKDFVYRMISAGKYKKSLASALVKAGAFDGLGGIHESRATLLAAIEPLTKVTKTMFDKANSYNERLAAFEEIAKTEDPNGKAYKTAERLLKNAETASVKAREAYETYTFEVMDDSFEEKLDAEYELLGTYITGNPFEAYMENASKTEGRITVYDAVSADITKDPVVVCGIIKDLQMLNRKKDGKQFCTFKVFDDTSEIEVKCFVNEFEQFKQFIGEKQPVTIKGLLKANVFYQETEDGDEEIRKDNDLWLKAAQTLGKDEFEIVIIRGKSIFEWQQNYPTIKNYQSDDGLKAVFIDDIDSAPRNIDFRVSASIAEANLKGLNVTTITEKGKRYGC